MLTISRNDIHGESLIDYGSEAYLKLPIEAYMKMVPVIANGGTSNVWEQTNRAQLALVNAINSPSYRFVCAALARRLGKTYIANIIAQMVILIPGCNVLIISPNYNLSNISFELQRKLVKTFDLELERDNIKDRILELSNGSTIRTGSIQQVDSCVGRSYDLILFDEAALSKDGENAFNVALRPTLDKPGAKAIFISTPRGKRNWFSRFHARGFDKEHPEWISLHADWTENSRMSVKDVNEARKVMTAAEFEQEYMASFTSYEGQIYTVSTENIIAELPQGKWEYIGGLDPGYKDPTAFVIIGYNLEENYFVIVEDYLVSEVTTNTHAAEIRKLCDKWGVETIFIDSAAAQFASDLAYQYDIATIKAKKQVLEGIAYVQTLVQQDRLKVLDNCTYVLDAFDQYQWDPNEALITEKPLHNDASHIADAVRYALYSFTI